MNYQFKNKNKNEILKDAVQSENAANPKMQQSENATDCCNLKTAQQQTGFNVKVQPIGNRLQSESEAEWQQIVVQSENTAKWQQTAV